MKPTPQWSAQAAPDLEVQGLGIEDANQMMEAAGLAPLDRGTLNALHRAGWHTVEAVIYSERKDLMFKFSIGDKRMEVIDSWRTDLLRLVAPESEPMSTAERVVVNQLRRKMPNETANVSTGEIVKEIRDGNHTELLRENLLELALLVPPGRAYSNELRQWLLEVARG
jgi:hypothetical protein